MNSSLSSVGAACRLQWVLGEEKEVKMNISENVDTKARVVHAAVGPIPEFVKILDWEGKTHTLMLVDEIWPPETPFFVAPEAKEKGQVSIFNEVVF